MRFYGGNSKRIIKKHSSFGFDGIYYEWDMAMFILGIIAKLKPGHKIWIPWTKEWGTIEEIHFAKRYLSYRRRPRGSFRNAEDPPNTRWDYTRLSRPVRGWHLDEPTIHVRGSNGELYYVYDIEHWNQDGATKEDVAIFNRQVGLPDDYDNPGWKKWY